MLGKTTVLYSAALIFSLASYLAGAEKAFKEASVQVGDIKTHYLDAGTGERYLVFIPDLTMTAEVWREQIPYFTARGFHVIAIDPRSHGLTGKTDGGNTYHQQAADLHAFLSKMKFEHCTLIGWSAGAVTLLEYVSSPETLRPDRLVFVGPVPVCPGDRDAAGGFTVPRIREMAMAMEEDRAKAAEANVRGLFKITQGSSVYKELSDASLKTPTGAALSLLLDLATGDRRSTLVTISVPTLIVISRDNQLFGEYLQSKIPGAQLQTVPDTGSALFLEKPQAFNQALEDFLSK